jgi:hypothetical protein
MDCTCKDHQDTLSSSGVKAGELFHDYHCPEAHVDAAAPSADKNSRESRLERLKKKAEKEADAAGASAAGTVTFERGSFPLSKPGEVTGLVINGRVYLLKEPVTLPPGEEIVVSSKKPLMVTSKKQGLPKRNGHVLCQAHDDCEIRNDGIHVQVGGAPCKKHARCSVSDYQKDDERHVPWPPVMIVKRQMVK